MDPCEVGCLKIAHTLDRVLVYSKASPDMRNVRRPVLLLAFLYSIVRKSSFKSTEDWHMTAWLGCKSIRSIEFVESSFGWLFRCVQHSSTMFNCFVSAASCNAIAL